METKIAELAAQINVANYRLPALTTSFDTTLGCCNWGCGFPDCTASHYADCHHIQHCSDGGEVKFEKNLAELARRLGLDIDDNTVFSWSGDLPDYGIAIDGHERHRNRSGVDIDGLVHWFDIKGVPASSSAHFLAATLIEQATKRFNSQLPCILHRAKSLTA